MNSGALDRELVRQYLLGRLDDQEELESKVSDEIFLSDASMDIVDSLEDEIIEDYVEGKLDADDQRAVEEYFLKPADRREKLRFYKLLRNHLATKRTEAPQEGALPARNAGIGWIQAARRAFPSLGGRLLVFGQAAALLALCVFGWTFRSGVRNKQAVFESELAQEKARSTQLAAQVNQLQPSLQILTLVSDRSRGHLPADSQRPLLETKPSTRRILVEIALTSSVAGSYTVRLESRRAREPIWTAKLLPLLSSSGDARLLFELPVEVMQAGSYALVVSSDSSSTDSGKYYDFDVQPLN